MKTVSNNSPRKVDTYTEDFLAFIGQQPQVDGWLSSLREKAFEEFSKVGFPIKRRGNELWKYTDIRPIDRECFTLDKESTQSISDEIVRQRAPFDSNWHNVVFVDGEFSINLSSNIRNSGLVLDSLLNASRDPEESVRPVLSKIANFSGDGFTALNTAFFNSGGYVRIPENTNVDAPIHLLHVTSNGKENRAIYPRVLLIAEKNSSATVIETYLNLSNSTQLIVPVLEGILEENSNLSHFRIQLESEYAFHIAKTRFKQSCDSKLSSVTFSTGPNIGRNDVHVELAETGSECSLSGLYITNHNAHQDNEISTSHLKPHGTSNQFYKGILAGSSRAVFSGKILVAPGAMKTEALQKDMNLLLSKGAEIDTKPSLEIYADDVKCAHGATAGHVDKNMLFYLQSRGVDKEVATKMLILGFASEILELFDPPPLKKFLYRVLEEIIPSLESDGIN